ncbi:DUF928 domain-containing protein [Oscillatoriales cyanobacterium LEGE 11467]|uniref:DUF928 domain-containing protein n=1 Tax=Zarconia navalis LEGE 11467 TaxID=1828826 RepID=A0A928VXA2_9CYAN|nr:DUF928 domain-containing protein [Zarconia navalis]MBE9040442.1 DUF928 domain-containing protein [Zarconia navalis LEGE 11467]
MLSKNSTFNRSISIGIGCTIAVISTTPKWSLAQTSDAISKRAIVTFQIFDPPPGEEEPDSTSGGGSRNDDTCLEESQIIALKPDRDRDGGSTETLSILSVYLPQTSAKTAIVNIEDIDRNSIYYDRLPISGEPGILRISLPKEILNIETENRYYWSFSVVCGEELDPNDPTLEGWVESIDGEFRLTDEANEENSLEETPLIEPNF